MLTQEVAGQDVTERKRWWAGFPAVLVPEKDLVRTHFMRCIPTLANFLQTDYTFDLSE